MPGPTGATSDEPSHGHDKEFATAVRADCGDFVEAAGPGARVPNFRAMTTTDRIVAAVVAVIFTLFVGVAAGFYLAKWHECRQGNTTFVCPGD